MIYRLIFLSILSLTLIPLNKLSGSGHFAITPDVEQIYQMAWEMSFDAATEYAAGARNSDPGNLMIHLAENYIDFIRIFLTDDLSTLERFRADVDRRLEILESGDRSSPYYYYSQAEIYIQWSLVRSKYGEVIRAGWDVNKAYKLLRACKKEYPDFIYADKSLAVIHTLMGSIKGFKKTMIKLFTSLEGTLEEGFREIENLYVLDRRTPGIWSDEIRTAYSLIKGHIQKDWNQAFTIIEQISAKRKHTPLGQYLIGSTANHAGLNEQTIEITKSDRIRKHSFYYLDLLTGNALLNKGDATAKKYFKRYLDNHHGQNFLKSSCQKMAWYELVINKDVAQYKFWMNRVLNIGDINTGEDQEAQLAANLQLIPNEYLLLSRLLFDGGYLNRALVEVEKLDIQSALDSEQLEYNYRKGRILQNLNRADEAIVFLKNTVRDGRDEKTYFACNAALQLAHIYFKKKELTQADKYVRMCLDIHPSERKAGLHDEAEVLKELIDEAR